MPAWPQPLSGHGQGFLSQLQRTGLVGEARARGARSHIAQHHVKRPQRRKPGLKGRRTLKNVLLRELHLGGKNRVRALDVAGQHEPLAPDPLRRAQRPGARRRAQIQHVLTGPEQAELGVQLFELVHGPGGVVLPLGLKKIVVPIFLHDISQRVSIHLLVQFAKGRKSHFAVDPPAAIL